MHNAVLSQWMVHLGVLDSSVRIYLGRGRCCIAILSLIGVHLGGTAYWIYIDSSVRIDLGRGEDAHCNPVSEKGTLGSA